jgi:hypothetical protein
MLRISAALMAFQACLLPALAQAPAPPPDPALQRAQAAFEALPEAERRQIQLDLAFATDFSGAALGTFGPLTYRGIQAFERAGKTTVDGVLEPAERAALAATAKRARDRLGFRVVEDPATKVALGLPMALLPKAEPQAPGGARWQTADGKATVALRAPASSEGTLEQLFEKTQASSNPQRKVTYKLLRPDFFVVAGETPQGKFYIRMAKLPDGALRGFSVAYDKSLAASWDRLTVAAANTFAPAGRSAAAQAAPSSAAAPTADPLAPRTFEKGMTGIVVAPGRVLTAGAFRSCAQPRIAGQPARLLAEDAASGLALVAADGLAAPPLSAPVGNPSGAVAVLASGSGFDGRRTILAVPGELSDAGVAAALQPGAAGAPVFGAGGLAGMVAADPPARLQVAGVVLAARHKVADGSQVERFMKAQGIAAPAVGLASGGASVGLGRLVERHGRSVVAIACG